MSSIGLDGLRAALGRIPLPHFDARESRPRMIQVRERLQVHWSSIDPKLPRSLDIKEIHAAARSGWTRRHDFSDVPARYRRWVPWVLFFPLTADTAWLARDPGFGRAYFAWLAEGRRPVAVAAIIKAFLQVYPKELPTFDELLRLARRTLRAVDSVRLDQWRGRDSKFDLLHQDGPARFAAHLSRSPLDPQQIILEAGFSGDLATSRFLELSLDDWIAEAREKLRRGSVDAKTLKQLLAAVTADQKGLRFPSHRVSLADALLSSFSERDASDEIRTILEPFFLDWYGDPRIGAAPRWQGVSDSAKQVMFRWLVGATLEDFFRLIDSTAYGHHWAYRKAFWREYLEARVIRDAWAVLGRSAQHAARGTLARQGGFGRLHGGDPSHSVLLLRIGHLTVVEWSHYGMCRIWHTASPGVPTFYRGEYPASALRARADFEQPHHHSERGSWQDKVNRYIRSQTGVSIRRHHVY